MKTGFGIFLALATGVAAVSVVRAGDRMGNGGDIRRFRSAWAIRYVRETTDLADRLRDQPGTFPAGCGPARALDEADAVPFAKFGSFFSSTTYEWNADPALTQCAQVFPESAGRKRFVFSYSRCPLELAPQQIVYLILDAAGASLGLSPDVSDRFAHFGNILRSPSCLGAPSDLPSGDDIFILNQFEDPAQFESHFARIRSRLLQHPELWIASDPAKHLASWEAFLLDAGLDPARLPQSEVVTEIKAWDVRRVSSLPQCSQTELKRFAPIEIAPADCGRISDDEEFQWLLLHETAHHFGYDDEASADRFAQAFSNLDVFENWIIHLRHPAPFSSR